MEICDLMCKNALLNDFEIETLNKILQRKTKQSRSKIQTSICCYQIQYVQLASIKIFQK
jgi:hypothetical protein